MIITFILVFPIMLAAVGGMWLERQIIDPKSTKLEECEEFSPEYHGLDFDETGLILKALYIMRDNFPNRKEKELNKLIHKMIERRNIIELEELEEHL